MADQDAVEIAVRALRTRDRTVAELEARLAERGVGDAERGDALETLDAGRVSRRRAGRARAGSGARGPRRGRRPDPGTTSTRRGVAAELVEEALGALEAERTRAEPSSRVAAASVQTVRYLAARGFGEDALEVIVARGDGRRDRMTVLPFDVLPA